MPKSAKHPVQPFPAEHAGGDDGPAAGEDQARPRRSAITLAADNGDIRPPAERRSRSSWRPLAILIVDPDPELRASAASRLQQMGHVVTSLSNCTDAWQLLQVRPFDVVIVDLETPAITAVELARRIRQLDPAPGIIAASDNLGERSAMCEDLARKNGFADVVPKGKSRRTYERRLRKLVADLQARSA